MAPNARTTKLAGGEQMKWHQGDSCRRNCHRGYFSKFCVAPLSSICHWVPPEEGKPEATAKYEARGGSVSCVITRLAERTLPAKLTRRARPENGHGILRDMVRVMLEHRYVLRNSSDMRLVSATTHARFIQRDWNKAAIFCIDIKQAKGFVKGHFVRIAPGDACFTRRWYVDRLRSRETTEPEPSLPAVGVQI